LAGLQIRDLLLFKFAYGAKCTGQRRGEFTLKIKDPQADKEKKRRIARRELA